MILEHLIFQSVVKMVGLALMPLDRPLCVTSPLGVSVELCFVYDACLNVICGFSL